MPSVFRGSDNFDTAGGNAVKAWVNFDGTTATPSTIRASFNVSSVTRNATGEYTINFTTAMPDTNYAMIGSSEGGATRQPSVAYDQERSITTSSMPIRLRENDGTVLNRANIFVAIFR